MTKNGMGGLGAAMTACLLLVLAGCAPQAVANDRLIGVWSAAESKIELREDGTALMGQFPIDGGELYSGEANWTLISRSDGQEVELNDVSIGHLARLHVDQGLFRITLYRVLCDPDEPSCIVRFELK